MTNWCARCGRRQPLDRMLTVTNPYRFLGTQDICIDCTVVSDRVVETGAESDESDD